MDAFETIVAQYLERKGYWVRQSVKVEISKEEKRTLNKPSMPRPEIDLVALDVESNELLLIEVKSYLDSYGVYYEAVSDESDEGAKRYKLLTNAKFREIVTQRLCENYIEKGLINNKTKINYGLAAGNIHKDNEEPIREYFAQKGWVLFSPNEIKEDIINLAESGWENNLVTMTAKLVMRKDK